MIWMKYRDMKMMTDLISYHFRIYYLTKETSIIRKIKEKFNTCVSVNGESNITTDEEGSMLLFETERITYTACD